MTSASEPDPDDVCIYCYLGQYTILSSFYVPSRHPCACPTRWSVHIVTLTQTQIPLLYSTTTLPVFSSPVRIAMTVTAVTSLEQSNEFTLSFKGAHRWNRASLADPLSGHPGQDHRLCLWGMYVGVAQAGRSAPNSENYLHSSPLSSFTKSTSTSVKVSQKNLVFKL